MPLGYGRAASNILILSHLILAILSLPGSLFLCVCWRGVVVSFWGLAWGRLYRGFRAGGGVSLLFQVSCAADSTCCPRKLWLKREVPSPNSSFSYFRAKGVRGCSQDEGWSWPLMGWYAGQSHQMVPSTHPGWFICKFRKEWQDTPLCYCCLFKDRPEHRHKVSLCPCWKVWKRKMCIWEEAQCYMGLHLVWLVMFSQTSIFFSLFDRRVRLGIVTLQSCICSYS